MTDYPIHLPIRQITIHTLIGVGQVCLNLQLNKQAHVFIGVNGIGKTKTLEAIYQALFFSNREVLQRFRQIPKELLFFYAIELDANTFTPELWPSSTFSPSPNAWHQLPVVFLASQNRGFINPKINHRGESLATFDDRRKTYFKKIIRQMESGFSSLNMNEPIDSWFAIRAKSANPYQKQEDNREIEIKTVLQLLNQIDERIDPSFIELDGDDRVSIKIEGVKKTLAQLSSGFVSILKMVQSIVSGYGYFTNETKLQQVKGIVLIDEIESHLHLSWQTNIVPTLKRLFPNTTFYISTHSPLVLSRLEQGEAYRLQRHEDGVVYADLIQSPNKAALVDVLKDAFDVDVNQNKLNSVSPQQQQEIRQSLQDFLEATK